VGVVTDIDMTTLVTVLTMGVIIDTCMAKCTIRPGVFVDSSCLQGGDTNEKIAIAEQRMFATLLTKIDENTWCCMHISTQEPLTVKLYFAHITYYNYIYMLQSARTITVLISIISELHHCL
jgi:hypothetical protein